MITDILLAVVGIFIVLIVLAVFVANGYDNDKDNDEYF